MGKRLSCRGRRVSAVEFDGTKQYQNTQFTKIVCFFVVRTRSQIVFVLARCVIHDFGGGDRVGIKAESQNINHWVYMGRGR